MKVVKIRFLPSSGESAVKRKRENEGQKMKNAEGQSKVAQARSIRAVSLINQSLGSMFRVIMQSAIMRMCWPLFLHPHI